MVGESRAFTWIVLLLMLAMLVPLAGYVEKTEQVPPRPATISSSGEALVLEKGKETVPAPTTISSISGEVLVQEEGSVNWIAAVPDMQLNEGDRLKTVSDVTTEIVFSEGSVLEVDADSETIPIEMTVAPDTGSMSIPLNQMVGNTINRVQKLIDSGSDYEAEPPTGTTVVRGAVSSPDSPLGEEGNPKSNPYATSQNTVASEQPKIEHVVFTDRARDNSSPHQATDQDKSFRLFRNASGATPPISYKINDETAPVDGAVGAVNAAFSTWDAATSAAIFNYKGTTTNNGDTKNGENTVSWAHIDGEGNTVAVTHVWLEVWPGGWQVVEFDMIFDHDDDWSIGAEENKFDVQNAATHEVGHTLFLDDLYLDKTAELTMYGNIGYAETKKCDLGVGDSLGIQHLCGE